MPNKLISTLDVHGPSIIGMGAILSLFIPPMITLLIMGSMNKGKPKEEQHSNVFTYPAFWIIMGIWGSILSVLTVGVVVIRKKKVKLGK
jgi:hypothetical protein